MSVAFDMFCGHVNNASLHGRQGRTTPLMSRRMDGSQHTTLSPKSLVPSFLIKVDTFAIELVKEVRVANMQLVGRDADDWACPSNQLYIFARISTRYSPYTSCSFEICLEYSPFCTIS